MARSSIEADDDLPAVREVMSAPICGHFAICPRQRLRKRPASLAAGVPVAAHLKVPCKDRGSMLRVSSKESACSASSSSSRVPTSAPPRDQHSARSIATRVAPIFPSGDSCTDAPCSPPCARRHTSKDARGQHLPVDRAAFRSSMLEAPVSHGRCNQISGLGSSSTYTTPASRGSSRSWGSSFSSWASESESTEAGRSRTASKDSSDSSEGGFSAVFPGMLSEGDASEERRLGLLRSSVDLDKEFEDIYSSYSNSAEEAHNADPINDEDWIEAAQQQRTRVEQQTRGCVLVNAFTRRISVELNELARAATFTKKKVPISTGWSDAVKRVQTKLQGARSRSDEVTQMNKEDSQLGQSRYQCHLFLPVAGCLQRMDTSESESDA